jgi:hypothetical protein
LSEQASDTPLGIRDVNSREEEGGDSVAFYLNDNKYRFFKSKDHTTYLPDGESTDMFDLSLYDQGDNCILAFTVHGDWSGIHTEWSPSSCVDRFIPGVWVSEFVTADKLDKNLLSARIEEQRNSMEKKQELKERFGI